MAIASINKGHTVQPDEWHDSSRLHKVVECGGGKCKQRVPLYGSGLTVSTVFTYHTVVCGVPLCEVPLCGALTGSGVGWTQHNREVQLTAWPLCYTSGGVWSANS